MWPWSVGLDRGHFGVHGGFTDRSLVFSAWQEVLQQEVGQAAQKAVHYKEATPSPHMDGEYSYCFSFLCYLQTPSLCFLRTVTQKSPEILFI